MARCVIRDMRDDFDPEDGRYVGEGGTRVKSLGDAKVFDPNSKRTKESFGRYEFYEFIPVMVVGIGEPK